ncbi:TPA: replication protein [Staphylococcus aureus]|nr:replication protein [Staphylococcus aureus]
MCPNSSIYSDEKSRVLVDKTKSGKVRPWREKKRFCCKVKKYS